MHELLSSKGKVFLQGIAGIGKSELIKAYAEKFKKEYTNIIYFTYSGNLTKDIANLDFADDINSNESVKNRFSRHNNFLRRLKEDSLIIVDNFNTTAGKDEAFPAVGSHGLYGVFRGWLLMVSGRMYRWRYDGLPPSSSTVREWVATRPSGVGRRSPSDASGRWPVPCLYGRSRSLCRPNGRLTACTGWG